VSLPCHLEEELADLDMARTAVRGRGGGGASRRHCTTLIGGLSGGASGISGQPRTECHWPPPLYIVQATGAHQPANGWAPPIRARTRSRGRARAVGLWCGGDQS
jgi:hypothetical protein